MKNSLLRGLVGVFSRHKNLMRMIKILLLLIISSTLTMTAATTYSQETKLSLTVENVTIKELLQKIKKQSDFSFFYNNSELNDDQLVTLDVKDQTINKILDIVLRNQNLAYEIKDKFILIYEPIVKTVNLSLSNLQQLKVTGTVTDVSTGETLVGVSIVVENTTIGVISDVNGKFVLNVPSSSSVLVFSFIGYKSEKTILAGRTIIDVKMTPLIQKLEEVVVIGYGSQKKSTLTGAVSNVSIKEIKESTNANVVNMLSGKLPGLRVRQNTGEPGDYNTSFDIRGLGSPLIIIDGVPRSNFVRLDPNEIESISILKDASAAIYGVKGGNGVVLVTTKRGSGKTEFNYSSVFGVSTFTRTPELLDGYGFEVIANERAVNMGSSPPFSKTDIQNVKDGITPTTDWFNLAVRKYSPMQQHNLSVNGSSEILKYFISLGYFDEIGAWKTNDLNAKRFNIRSNLTAKLSKNLEAELLLNGIWDTKNAPVEGDYSIFKGIWMNSPIVPAYANNNPAYPSTLTDNLHPAIITNSSLSGYNKNSQKTFNGTFALNYKIPFVDGLKARAMFAYDNNYIFQKIWSKKFQTYTYDKVSQTYNVTGVLHNPSNLSERYAENIATTIQTSLDYQRSFDNVHNVKALLLFEESKKSGTGFQGAREFSFDAVDQLYAGNVLNQSTNNFNVYPAEVNEGIIGRVNYDFKGKYLIEGSFRFDGSSKFAENRRWGFFPAVSAGWRISEEPFLKDKIKFLTNLKIRASYGKLGDDASSFYQYLDGYTYPSTQNNYILSSTNPSLYNSYVFGNSAYTPGLGFMNTANPNLTWFTINYSNIGMDLDLWTGKLHAEMDVFRRERNGLLATRSLSLPGTVGASLPQENLNGDLQQGIEILLSHRNNIGNFNYNISGNFSFTRGKNLNIERVPSGNSYLNWRDNKSNRWSDIYWGYHIIGQFQSFEEIKNSPVEDGNGNRKLLPGDFKLEDVNKDGIIDINDTKPIGNNSNTPEIMFGFTLGAQWKGFDLNILFQGATNFTVTYLSSDQLTTIGYGGRNGLAFLMDRWHKEDLFDPASPWVPGKYPSTIKNINAPWNYSANDFWLNDASYLRLKSVEIGYTFSAKILGKIGVKTLRIYTNGYNLYTWSGLNNLVDPEHPSTNAGYEYPITTNYNLGLNITF